MKAVVLDNKKAVLIANRAVPKLRDDYMLVKTVAVALNPTDWKHVLGIFSGAPEDGILGCDYAGIVEEVGKDVTKPFEKGDRVAGCAHGGNWNQVEDGAFAEYIMVKGDLQMKIPDSLSFEKASTIGLGAATVAQGLYQKALGLNLPTNPIKEKTYVLIYGGSTATGTLGIQYAKLSGYSVITTCSPHNFDLVRSLGAEAVFDYRDHEVGAKIRAYTNDSLKYVWDTVSEEGSAKICADALSSDSTGCVYGTILGVQSPRSDVKSAFTFIYTIFGENVDKVDMHFPASREDFEYAKMFATITENLLAEGKLKNHPEKVGSNGLKGVIEGLKELESGTVSGEKLVYRVVETP